MQADFWLRRWRDGEIGWHQPDVHPALERFWPSLGVEATTRVLVPLCGRSLDMTWLARRGHRVLGVELSPIAVAGYFEHEGLAPCQSSSGAFTSHTAGPCEILQGDFFDLDPRTAGPLGGWYDRAALVALPPAMRDRYVARIAGLVGPGTPGLLVSAEYPQEKMEGPPFSVPADEIRRHFGADFQVELLHREDLITASPRFAARGLDSFHEAVFRLIRR